MKIFLACPENRVEQFMDIYKDYDVIGIYDSHSKNKEVKGIPVVDDNDILKLKDDAKVIICHDEFSDIVETASKLRETGIGCTCHGYNEDKGIPHRTIRIHGKVGALAYEFNDRDLYHEMDRARAENTIAMYKKMFEVYKDDFEGEEVDIHVCIDDSVLEAYEMATVCGYNVMHAYSTSYAVSDKVIPIPDYRACFDEDEYYYKESSPKKCWEAAEKTPIDNRAFWIGLMMVGSRSSLWLLSKKHPDKLLVVDSKYKRLEMPEQAKYKYLVDVRGYGWTDRVKTLLMLGRPLLLVDRPSTEWYFDKMEPMKHYVPIKEDMSDLIEKIDYLNEHDDVYKYISENGRRFADEYLMPKGVLSYLRDVTMRYDIV